MFKLAPYTSHCNTVQFTRKVDKVSEQANYEEMFFLTLSTGSSEAPCYNVAFGVFGL